MSNESKRSKPQLLPKFHRKRRKAERILAQEAQASLKVRQWRKENEACR